MGTTLHEGEYILISKKITNEAHCFGYALLSIIGINTSKVNYIGPTKNFLTFAVIKDLELPFSINEWQDFEVKDVKFHAYTKNFKNLILLEKDEFSLDYVDELDEFFVKKKMENNEMIIKQNNYIYIATNTTDLSDEQLIAALLGYVPTYTKYEMIHQYVCNELWSRTKFLHERSFDSIDAHRRLQERDEKLSFVMTEKGDVIIYRDIVSDKSKIFSAYYEYSKNDEPETLLRDANGRPIAGRYPYRVNANNTILPPSVIDSLSLNIGSAFWAARGTGKSVMTMKHMLNSFYGLNGGLNNKKPPFKFELRFGIEHATGRYKTICLWEDGEKTIICGDNKATKLPIAQAFAWCYVKRTFRSVSQFKKHVDKRTTKMDGVWYFEGDCLVDEYAQGSVPGSSKKRDIYDAAALAIVSKRYGGLRKLVDEYINKKENE